MGEKHVPVAMVSLVGDPKTYREATQSAEAEKRRDAMRSEIDSLKANGTLELIIRPPGQNCYIPSGSSRPRSTQMEH